MTFGERIIALRKEKGYVTRKSFAEKLKIPETTLRNYEKNEREPGHSFLIDLSDIFNVSTDYLLGLTDEKEKVRPYELKASEYKHIEKYRKLDMRGKKIVETVLDEEITRIEELQDQQNQINMLKQRIVTELAHRIAIPLYGKFASAGGGAYLFDDIPTDMIEVEDTPTARKADFVIGVDGDSMEPDFYDGDKIFVKKTTVLNVGDIGIFLKGSDCYIKELGEDRLISRNKSYTDIYPDEEIRRIGKVLGKVEEN
ncbi:MAG: helix-turn-helix domain-containing protein [Lachnospiraceae bacterium]|nr:helix-turn-helix domain-containing protein [Lachnospiraceae bacterium]